MMRTMRQLRPIAFAVFALVCSFTSAELVRRTSAHISGARSNEVPAGPTRQTGVYDVRAFGAKGDGKTLDTPAINKAIATAASNGGGTVLFPAGTYLSVSIHLKSNIALYIEQGATIVAAEVSQGVAYDPPEPNQWDAYQDFGHSHWHNSLIWGENLENISILGPGMIWGKGLVRGGGHSRTKEQNDALEKARLSEPQRPFGYPNPRDTVESGWANKSISLKLCRNVLIRDISILHGGHFAILATGVDNLTIDNLKIDTNQTVSTSMPAAMCGFQTVASTRHSTMPFARRAVLRSATRGPLRM